MKAWQLLLPGCVLLAVGACSGTEAPDAVRPQVVEDAPSKQVFTPAPVPRIYTRTIGIAIPYGTSTVPAAAARAVCGATRSSCP